MDSDDTGTNLSAPAPARRGASWFLISVLCVNVSLVPCAVLFAADPQFPLALSHSFVWLIFLVVVLIAIRIFIAIIRRGQHSEIQRGTLSSKNRIVSVSAIALGILICLFGVTFAHSGALGPALDHRVFADPSGTFYSWTSTGLRTPATGSQYGDYLRQYAFTPLAVAIVVGGFAQIYAAVDELAPGLVQRSLFFPISSRFGRIREKDGSPDALADDSWT